MSFGNLSNYTTGFVGAGLRTWKTKEWAGDYPAPAVRFGCIIICLKNGGLRLNRLQLFAARVRGVRARIFFPLALLALCFSAYSQITTASLEGVVRDSTGAVFAGAHVLVVNTATNVATAVSTDS